MVSRRAVLSAAVAGAGAGTVFARGVRPASATTLATVSVDLAAPQGPFPFRLGGQLSATPKSWRYAAATTSKLDALHLRKARVWLKYQELAANPDLGNEYLDYYHERADSLLLNWQTGYATASAVDGFNLEAFIAAQADMLACLKKRYPKLEFVEAENEDFASGQTVGAYYAKYQVVYRVVNQVNQLRLPQGQLQVGGPVLDVFSELRLGQFFDAYQADPRTDKRLDFVSYHQYLINTTNAGAWDAIKDYPAVVSTERVPRPYHNALLAMSMLPSTRCVATSDSLSSRGTGVYGLAGVSEYEIAVLTWNYQWTNRIAFDSRIKLTGFPEAFRDNQVRVTRYRMARTVADAELKPVHTFLIPPRLDGGYVSETYPLEPNELRLLVLTPER